MDYATLDIVDYFLSLKKQLLNRICLLETYVENKENLSPNYDWKGQLQRAYKTRKSLRFLYKEFVTYYLMSDAEYFELLDRLKIVLSEIRKIIKSKPNVIVRLMHVLRI